MVYGKKGLEEVISNIKTNNKDFNLALKEFINKRSDKKVKNENDLIYLSGNSITGQFLKRDYLKLFSPKFHKALSNIESLIEGKKGPKTAFIYSNLVTLGINLFKQVLIQNGFVEFIENKEKTINSANDNTVCYYCGKKKIEHDKVHSHVYYPASFIVITGDSDEEVIEDEKKKQMDLCFAAWRIGMQHAGKCGTGAKCLRSRRNRAFGQTGYGCVQIEG